MGNSTSRESRSSLKSALVVGLKAAEAGVDGLPIPGVKGCISGILQIIEQEELRNANVTTFRGLVDKVSQLHEVTVGRLLGETNIPEDLKSDVRVLAEKLNSITAQYKERIGERSKMRRIKRFFSAQDDAEALNNLGESLKTAIEVFHTASVMNLRMAEQKREADRCMDEERRVLEEQKRQAERRMDEERRVREEQKREAERRMDERRRLMDKLAMAVEPKSYFDAHRERPIELCQLGTRVSLLEDVAKWVEGAGANHCRILWLNGRAGVGKSTIAKTLATRFNDAKTLGGSFMFSKPNGVTDGSKVCTTLAYQLARHLPEFGDHLVAAIRDNESSIKSEIPQQFKNLLEPPLSQLQSSPVTVIILDALDECSPETLKSMLTSIFEIVVHFPFLRIIITSRPEPPIQQVIQRFEQHICEKDINIISVSDDIEKYFRARLSDAYSQITTDANQRQGWPADDDLSSLVKMANNLFIFAATSVRFIGDERAAAPQRRLDIILRGRHAGQKHPLSGVDAMYREILQSTLGDGESDIYERFQAVVSSILFSERPCSVDSLVKLLAPKYSASDIRNSLKFLHSVLIVPETNHKAGLQVYHKSFADFITDPDRCTLTEAYLDPPTHHERLCLRYLEMAESTFDTLPAAPGNAASNRSDAFKFAAAASPILRKSKIGLQHWLYHLRAFKDQAKDNQTKAVVLSTLHRVHVLLESLSTYNHLLEFQSRRLIGNSARMFQSTKKQMTYELSEMKVSRFSARNSAPAHRKQLIGS